MMIESLSTLVTQVVLLFVTGSAIFYWIKFRWFQDEFSFRFPQIRRVAKYNLLITFLIVVCISACVPMRVEPAELRPVQMQLNWVHQAQFSGFYAAALNGYYEENGISVSFREAGVADDPIQPILDGTAQFGMLGADQMISAVAEGKPIRAIAVVFRRSPVVFIAPAESGITHPHDFAGKTIRVTTNLVPSLHAMTTHVGVTPQEYTEVIMPSDISLWAAGEADVWGVYVNAFAVTLEREGYKLNYIFPDDYGVHFYGDVIFTSNKIIEQDPDLVLKFLEATLRGYTYAVENPHEIGKMVLIYQPQADSALEQAKMLASLPLIHTDLRPIGWMELIGWEEVERTLREQNIVTRQVDVSQVFTTQFLSEIYGDLP